MIAAVRSVMAASIFAASIWNVRRSVLTNTGRALSMRTALTQATNVNGGRMTSSPACTPTAISATISELVPLVVAMQCLAPIAWAHASSKRVTFCP